MSEIIAAFMGAAVLLLGIWLKAYLDHIFEKRAIIAVAYAELAELMSQLQLKYVADKEAREKVRTDPIIQQRIERYKAQVRATMELSKEYGAKSLVQTGPMSLGRLGPDPAYAVRSQYARIESLQIRVGAQVIAAGDIESVLEFLDSAEAYEKEIGIPTRRWETIRTIFLQAAGTKVKALVEQQSEPQ